MPALFEGSCPFPILESLTVDTLVAISRIEVAREVISDMNAFVTFVPYSVPEMTAAIAHLNQNRQLLVAQEKAAIWGKLQSTGPTWRKNITGCFKASFTGDRNRLNREEVNSANSTVRQVVVIGAGGHANVAIDILKSD